jgi:heterotetrameric sarcosine oxidase delta subunit
MLIIKCPYCGEREQEEFACGGEAHIVRPKNSPELTDDQWADYLFIRQNKKGIQFERWNHAFGCRQWFNVARNTATDEIIKIYNMGEKAPNVEANEPATPSGEPVIGSGNFSTSINISEKK